MYHFANANVLIRNGRQPKSHNYLINPAQLRGEIDLFVCALARRKNTKMTMTKDQGQQFANNDSDFQTMDDQNGYGDVNKMQSMNENNQHQVVSD